MANKPRDEAIELSFFGREDYFAYYYAYARHQASCFTPGGHYTLKP
jgi:hypothetical protein